MARKIQRIDILYNALREPTLVSLRKGFTILSLESRGGVPALYVAGDPQEKSDDRWVRLFISGEEVPEGSQYLGSIPFGDGDRALIAFAFFVPKPIG